MVLLGGWLLREVTGPRAGPTAPARGELGEGQEDPDGDPFAPEATGDPDAVPAPDRDAVPASAPPPGRIHVRIVARLAGFARVDVRDSSGTLVSTVWLTAEDPDAELECLPGEYELVVEHPGPPALGAPPARAVLAPGATATVEFVLTALRRLSGRVADDRNLGVEDVPVALERDGRIVHEAHTRVAGAFVFPPLPEGEYSLVVGDPLGPIVPRRLVRLDAELADQEVRVPMLLELEVLVVDERGLAVAGAEVEGIGEKGGRVAGVTDADGRLWAARLPSGNYRVFARHSAAGRGNRAFVLSDAHSGALEIRLLTPQVDGHDPKR
jgi:hypothetical protein